MHEKRALRETGSETRSSTSRVARHRVERALAASVIALLATSVAAAESMHPGTRPAAPAGFAAVSLTAGAVAAPAGSAVADPVAAEVPEPVDEVPEPTVRLASFRPSEAVVWPAQGPLTGWFGEARGRRRHEGIDIFGPVGAPVLAAAPGTVVIAAASIPGYGGYGKTVVIDQGNGVSTLYAHLSSIDVTPGQRVNAGDRIGAMGMTGAVTAPHLHFEVKIGPDKVDPSDWLESSGAGHRPRHHGR